MHANFIGVAHGARRRADDDARRRRGGVDEFAQRMRVLEGLVMYKPHRAAHQMGRAERLAPRVRRGACRSYRLKTTATTAKRIPWTSTLGKLDGG